MGKCYTREAAYIVEHNSITPHVWHNLFYLSQNLSVLKMREKFVTF